MIILVHVMHRNRGSTIPWEDNTNSGSQSLNHLAQQPEVASRKTRKIQYKQMPNVYINI